MVGDEQVLQGAFEPAVADAAVVVDPQRRVAHPPVVGLQLGHHRREVVGVPGVVAVEERHVATLRPGDADVARVADAAVVGHVHVDPVLEGEDAAQDLLGVVGGPVVDDVQLPVAVGLGPHGVDGPADLGAPVPGGHDDADERPGGIGDRRGPGAADVVGQPVLDTWRAGQLDLGGVLAGRVDQDAADLSPGGAGPVHRADGAVGPQRADPLEPRAGAAGRAGEQHVALPPRGGGRGEEPHERVLTAPYPPVGVGPLRLEERVRRAARGARGAQVVAHGAAGGGEGAPGLGLVPLPVEHPRAEDHALAGQPPLGAADRAQGLARPADGGGAGGHRWYLTVGASGRSGPGVRRSTSFGRVG